MTGTVRRRLVTLITLALLAAVIQTASAPPPAAAGVPPPDFTDNVALAGLSLPTAVAFSPDGRVFVAEKRGTVKVFDDLFDASPDVFADLRTNVYNHWDRGLLGLTLHPNFPTEPYVYVSYTYDYDPALPGQVPRWGTPDTDNDPCPTPPGANESGCVVTGRVSQLVASGNTMTAENVLVEDWCQQFPSHSLGDLEFGADGALYASAGEGANFGTIDTGDLGTPPNPCGDPVNEGGALRAQDLRTPGDPLNLHGSILRLDPLTGAAAADNPSAGSSDPNEARIVANGLRNPFRFGVRPGTNELYIGDVGWGTWEEVNVLLDPAGAPVENFGWPCYEGSGIQPTYAALNLGICSDLYAEPGAETAPLFEYNHADDIVPGEDCTLGGSSPTGVAFYQGGDYPSAFTDAMFFSDFSRRCIWYMEPGGDGRPDGSTVATFVTDAAATDLEIGPGGDLFYVDILDGALHRIEYTAGNHPPVAQVIATPQSGDAPLVVTLDASGSTDPDPGDTLSFDWDLDGDGTFGDAIGPVVQTEYAAEGIAIPAVRATDTFGATDLASTIVSVGGTSVPGPAAGGWTLNGSATLTAGTLRLTDAVDFQTGTAFNPTPVDSSSLTISFDAFIGSGSGGDGLALALIDGTGAPTAVGFGGGGLGYAGLDGVGVTLDTAQGPGEPAENFVGIATGGTGAGPTYVATATNLAELEETTTHIDAIVTDGLLRVFVESREVLQTPVSLPPTVLIGFTGATGGSNNVHEIDNVRISAPPLAPANLQVTPETVNFGTVVEGTTTTSSVVVSNTGGSALTITDVSGPTGAFTIPSPQIQVGTVLVPGATATEKIEFSPTTDGVVSETYTVTADDGSGPHLVALNGTVESDLSPTATIASPTVTDNWAVGDVMELSGSAVDYTGAPIPEADLTWSVRLHHCVVNGGCHVHPVTDIVGQAEATFVAPDHEYPSWLEVELAATDSEGTGVASVEVQPTVHTIQFATGPSGLNLLVGSAGGGKAPLSRELIEGSLVPIVAPTPQTFGGAEWTWSSWSDGGAAAHSYLVPSGPATVTATFAPSGAALLASPQVLDFGTVAHGSVSTLDVVLTNPGSSDVTLTAVTPPAAPFSDPSPPAAGTVIPAGTSITQTVELAPTAVGTASGTYVFEPDSGQGPITVTLTAEVTPSGCPAGTVAGFGDFTDPAWQINGDAGLDAGELQLTPAAGGQAGTAFWTDAVASDDLSACFVADIGGGSGADGLALVLLDASAPPTSVGAAGGGLGVDGLPATAVALDTYGGGGAGQSGNDVAIAPSTAPLAYSTIVPISPDFRGRDTQVEVTVEGGQLTVAVDNTVVASEAVTLPPAVHVGFAAATGGATDRHAVAVASLDAEAAGGAPDVSAAPAAVSFGTVDVGSTATAELVLSNSGGTDATVAAVTPPAAPFTDPAPITVGTVIPAGGSLTQTIAYDPSVAGTDTGAYTVETVAGQVITVPLDGTAVEPGSVLVASPPTVDYGTIEIGSTATATVTIANTGPTDVALTAVSAPAAPFEDADPLEAGDVIPAGGSVTQTVTYQPDVVGADTGTYVIESDTQALTVSLSGEGSEPATAALSASPAGADFGTVEVGSSSSLGVVVTNVGAVDAQLTGVTLPDEPFGVGAGAPAVDDVIPAGGSVTVDVTFAPTAAGSPSSSLVLETADQTLTVPVTGEAIEPSPGPLTAAPVDFGPVTVGDTATTALTVTNTGATGVTLSAATPPAAPFGDAAPPAAGTTIAPGASITQTVSYAPTAPVADSDAYVFETASQTLAVPVSGSGVTSPATLAAAPDPLDFGSVTVGSTATEQVTVTNSGGTDAVITAVTEPAAPFSISGAGLVAGDLIPAGGSVAVSIGYAPVTAGADSGTYVIETEAGTVSVALAGAGSSSSPGSCGSTGTLPAVGDPSWSLNGSASATAGGVELTGATEGFAAGATFHPTVVDTAQDVAICFDAAIVGGTGADGMTLALVDASIETTTAIGGIGGQLGFGGVEGVAITFDTWANAGEPAEDFVGLAVSQAGTAGIGYLATAPVPGGLDGQTRAVEVEIAAGTVTVTVDGIDVLSEPVPTALPEQALIGFTAGTGGATNAHRVLDSTIVAQEIPPPVALSAGDGDVGSAEVGSADRTLTVTPDGANQDPVAPEILSAGDVDPGSVEVGSSSQDPVAPGVLSAGDVDLGSVEVGSSASLPVVVSNTGGSDVVLTEVVVPSSPFGVSGEPAVGDVVPAGGSVSFDLSFDPAVTGPVSDALVLTSADQTLTVALDGVGQDPAPPTGDCTSGPPSIQGPEGTGWTFNGVAAASATGARITPDVISGAGSVVYDTPIDPSEMSICFDLTIGGGSGAGGLTLAFLDADEHDTTALGADGSQLGFGGLAGTAITFDTSSGGSEPAGDVVGLATGVAGSDFVSTETSTAAGTLEGSTHAVQVTISAGQVTVVVDGVTTIDAAITLPSAALLAFTAATGSGGTVHDVDEVVIV